MALPVMATGVPALALPSGTEDALTAVQGEVVSAVPLVPGPLASRAQTEKLYAPAGLPVVFKSNIGLVEYDRTTVHVPPGGFIQN